MNLYTAQGGLNDSDHDIAVVAVKNGLISCVCAASVRPAGVVVNISGHTSG